ncbi:uncharacterized protein LOC135400468 [Ornithodoros turicata]|uniref:uncharacterized protein LOC135400468 n=1 Tax=Ornithodoros turicata TaxID=34597 RepID=UPI003138EA22
MYDDVQNNVRGLRSLGVSSASYASMMVDIPLSALPSELVVEYHRLARYGTVLEEPTANTQSAQVDEHPSSSVDPTTSSELTKVLNFLRIEIESRERSGVKDRTSTPQLFPTPQRTTTTSHRTPRAKGSNLTSTGAVLQSSAQVAPKCFFCNAVDHDAPHCQCSMSLAEKRSKLAKDMRCYRCTKRGHRSKDCRSRISCSHCGRRHAPSLCDPSQSSQSASTEPSSMGTTNMMATHHHSVPAQQDTSVLLQTFRAWATSDQNAAYIRGIIDGGSQRTFIREDVATKLKLTTVGETTLQINAFANNTHRTPTIVKIVKLGLRSQYGPQEYSIEALTVPFICKDLTATPEDHEFVQSICCDHVFIADELVHRNVPSEVGISLLIGCDQMWKLLTGELKRCDRNEKFVAISTVFGWTFQGPATLDCRLSKETTTAVCVLRVGGTQHQESDVLKRFWELDSIGITDADTSNVEHNASILEEFQRQLTMKDGRYEVTLPWKAGTIQMADNLELAKSRLRGLVRRLQRNGQVVEYDEAIQSYIENGHAERVVGDSPESRYTYYMPHRAVIRSGSTSTRVRVVFDASSHGPGAMSLNDHLEKGPKLNSDLVPILLRFRMHTIAVTADIQKAFLQVGINPADRDALRFMWFTTAPLQGSTLPPLEVWRMTRVPFGTTASPFQLSATLQHHLRCTTGSEEDIAHALINSFYVDDLLTGANKLEEAQRIVSSARRILQKAGMQLTKFASNSSELQTTFEQFSKEDHNAERRLCEPEDSRVLGIVWNKSTDHLKFSGEHLLDTIIAAKSTKRSVLQTSAKIFDPLGFLSPYTIRVKILFHRLWERGLDWDAPLPADISKEWDSWCADLPKLHSISLERCLLPGEETDYSTELHIFTDASPQAYGACAFLRVVDAKGNIKVGLVFAKSRVAPLKKLTLPRLELMGAMIGVRIAKLVCDSLPTITNVATYWTDSSIVLGWIKGNASKWKPFVKNRVMEIQEKSDPSHWRHCPGVFNPADALTRGLTVSAMAESRLWFLGPSWLAEVQSLWPPAGT